MCLSLERFITVCYPFFKLRHRFRFLNSSKNLLSQKYFRWEASYYVIPVTAISLIYNIPRFFELTVIDMRISTGNNLKDKKYLSHPTRTPQEEEFCDFFL